MKKISILTAAILCMALSACAGQSVQESGAPVTALPTASVAATATPEGTETPAAQPTPLDTVQPTLAPVPEPVPTPAPTPTLTSAPAPTPGPTAQPSAEPSVEVTATPAPEVTDTPEIVETAEPTDTPEPDQPPAAPEETPEVEPSSEPAPEAQRPTDEEVLEAYHKAHEAFGWFNLCTMADWESGESVEWDGYHYYPVRDERFPNLDSLRGYLKGLFSDEVIDQLLPAAGATYIDIDGSLYAMDVERGTDENSGAVAVTVDWPEEGDSLCTVRVTVELLWADPQYPEGERVYEFPYQKVGDKWVFTSFEPIK